MDHSNISPTINSIRWGQVSTADGFAYKDAKLFPGGSKSWDWNETGTRHEPGIQPADIRELLEHGAEVIVLSKGFNERLQVCQETIEELHEKGIDFYILQTEKAVKKYNKLAQKKAAGALIHSTC